MMSPSFHRQDTKGDFTGALSLLGFAGSLYIAALIVMQLGMYFTSINEPNGLPLIAPILIALMYGGLIVGYFYWRGSRRLRDRVLREGTVFTARVLSKDSDIYGVAIGGGNIEYSMTLVIDLNNEDKQVKTTVDDFLYHRLNPGDAIRIKLLPNQPDAWVFLEKQT